MNPLALGGIVQAIGQIADDLVTTDKERLDAELELRRLGLEGAKIEADLVRGQLQVNQAEATSSSLFVAGWRPAIGWIGATALGYQFLLYPLLIWAWALLQARGVVPAICSRLPCWTPMRCGSSWPGCLALLGRVPLRR